MRDINLYARAFKSCAQRLVDNFDSMIKIHLKRNYLNKLIKETHNKFTSNEMIVLIIMLDNLDDEKLIERDIFVQNQNDELQIVFY